MSETSSNLRPSDRSPPFPVTGAARHLIMQNHGLADFQGFATTHFDRDVCFPSTYAKSTDNRRAFFPPLFANLRQFSADPSPVSAATRTPERRRCQMNSPTPASATRSPWQRPWAREFRLGPRTTIGDRSFLRPLPRRRSGGRQRRSVFPPPSVLRPPPFRSASALPKHIAARFRLHGISVVFEKHHGKRLITLTKTNRPGKNAVTRKSLSHRTLLRGGVRIRKHRCDVTPIPARP